ncbi:universal stress protein [Amycolatopsis regifaucium]|uniref:Universal stress protein UspA n=1 Tax=Amycolatopsis regifaucium TaxID=546365 RepID=A0A154M4J7_9PSEU|nr:universal stress protein [Amycolatopsis regifaucium]KZB79554.1 universal stress protein UspA [Amycolatopsis regifaucium]OKA07838.1 universal stress protein UspA [Amycolatopsis regifaucium]SFH10087.1 Nucleotide-binding universal stress protein, UspA family [Amycolatopsis regifaucium]
MSTAQTGAGPVVVGFDGSGEARRAVRWALTQAKTRARGLVLAYCARDRLPPPGADLVASPLAGAVPEAADEAAAVEPARRQLGSMAEALHRTEPDLDVRTVVRGGTPEAVLTSVADETDAAMIVLGESHTGVFTRAMLGSTEAEVTKTAGRPVIVVRGEESAPGGPVVLGTDGSEQSSAAAAFAFDFAARHGLAVHAVHVARIPVWGPTSEPLLGGPILDPAPAAPQEISDELVDRQLKPLRERFPEVAVEVVHGIGPTGQALTGQSSDAALLVLGRSEHGPLRRLLLGSISDDALHHARCPVAVVRA